MQFKYLQQISIKCPQPNLIVMNKQFYNQLGDQLCNMKNSPFMRIGQPKTNQSLTDSTVKMKRSLSYDPDRLFDPQKYKQKQQAIEEQDYKKLIQQQKQEMFNIEYDLLKKNTHEMYEKELQKYRFVPKLDHKEPYSWFGKCRGGCMLCQKCTEYEGCFSLSQKFPLHSSSHLWVDFDDMKSQTKVEIMECYKCKCPMNAHVLLETQPALRGEIYKHLISKNIQDNYLNTNHIVLAFKFPRNKVRDSNCILELLANLRCTPVNHTIQSKLEFELAMVKAQIIQKGNTQKSYIESLLNLVECIRAQRYWNWSQSKAYIHEHYEELYNVIKKIGMEVERQTQVSEGEFVMVLLCEYDIDQVRNLIKYLSGNDRVPDINRAGGPSSVISTQASSLSSQYGQSRRHNNYYGFNEYESDVRQLQEKYQIRFIYGTNQRKQSLILSQYFFKENYQINYSLFLLPGGALIAQVPTSGTKQSAQQRLRIARQQYQNSSKFKDILDYNRYIIFMENIKEYDRVKFESALTRICGFKMSKINYIVGEQLLNQKIRRVSLKLAVKIGLPGMTIPFHNAPDFFTVRNTNKMEVPRLMRELYPELTYSQRCIFIIRPFVLISNFEQVIVNMLRINNFILLKRTKVKLSDSEVAYLATLEKIPQQMLDQYTNYMTAGVCEIILTSKRSAIYEAYALSNGCFNGPVNTPLKSLKNAGHGSRNRNSISVQIKKGREVFEEQLPLGRDKRGAEQVFKSLRELIDIEKVLFGYITPIQYSTNLHTKQIVKIDSLKTGLRETEPTSEAIKVTNKIKESLLKEIRKEDYNFWVFTSLSETLTQQLAALFLPECTLFQPITVLVKPGLIHLVPLIKKTLLEHKYHIIAEKEVQMSRQIAMEFAYNCQKIRLSNQILKQITDAYSKEKTYILVLSKISGRKQVMSMLSGFSFLLTSESTIYASGRANDAKESVDFYAEDAYISDQMLYDMLVPVWNNEQLCLKLICPPLAHMEESIHAIIQGEELQRRENAENGTHKSVLSKYEKFMVLNYLVGSFFGVGIEDLDMHSKLGRLCYYITNDPLISKLQSWYYAQVSYFKPNYIPLLFQYRQIGQTIMCIQSDRGAAFMETIISMYAQEQKKIKERQDQDRRDLLLNGINKKSQRRSLILFLWAKKLEELCMDLSTLETQLKGYGDIIYKNGEYCGQLTWQQGQEQELRKLSLIQSQFDERDIKQNIKRLIESRHQKQRHLPANHRLLPSFHLINIEQCVRIVEKTETSKLHLMDKYSFIDPENQVSKLKDLYSLHLYNVLPQIQTKYNLVAEVYYFMTKFELENPDLGAMIQELCQIFSDLLTEHHELEIMEYQIYLKMLLEFSNMPPEYQFRRDFFSLLKSYPNLRKNKKIDRDEVAGKKRKFLDHKQYFKRANQQTQQARETLQKKYMNVDLNEMQPQIDPNPLYNPDDPLHHRFAHSKNIVNLLREGKNQEQRAGIYVQYEKNISQKQEILKEKIKKEVEKFSVYQQDEILYETGLERDLWYRRAKGDRERQDSKTNTAINKQIERFMSFKKDEQKKKDQSSAIN